MPLTSSARLTLPMIDNVPGPVFVTVPEPAKLPVHARSVGVWMRNEPAPSTFSWPPVMADKEPGLNSSVPFRILMAPLTQPVVELMTSVPAPTLVKEPGPLSNRPKVAVPEFTLMDKLPAMPTLMPEVPVRVL